MDMQRFSFRFWNAEQYRAEAVVIMGHHRQDAEVGAWSVLAEVTHDRNPRDSWRLVSIEQAPVGLRRILRAAVAGLALVLAVTSTAGAAPQYINQVTVGDFRGWSEPMQIGYVLGARSYSGMLGTLCQRDITVGETAAAIRWDPRLNTGDSLAKAFFALEMREGCRIPETK